MINREYQQKGKQTNRAQKFKDKRFKKNKNEMAVFEGVSKIAILKYEQINNLRN